MADIVVDFDGTLTKRDEWPGIAPPRRLVIALLWSLQRRGHRLVLSTARQVTIDTLTTFSLPVFDAINENLPDRTERFGYDCRKVTGDYILDDRACTFVVLRAVWLWLRLVIFSRRPKQ